MDSRSAIGHRGEGARHRLLLSRSPKATVFAGTVLRVAMVCGWRACICFAIRSGVREQGHHKSRVNGDASGHTQWPANRPAFARLGPAVSHPPIR